MTMRDGLRTWRVRVVVWGLLSCAVVGVYLGWMGWRRPLVEVSATVSTDPYSTVEIVRTILTVAVLTAMAAVVDGRARPVASVAFWSLLVVNGVDMGMRPSPDANMWPVSAVVLGPVVWLAFHLPARRYDRSRQRWGTSMDQPVRPGGPPVGQSRTTAPDPPDTDQQVAAWRAHRARTMDG